MSRGFYRVVLCAFATREKEGTLNVMVRAFTRYIGDLGKSRQPLMPKAWHTHGNKPHRGEDFYPLLAKVSKGIEIALHESEHRCHPWGEGVSPLLWDMVHRQYV
jgi:hypothetical protein